MKYKRYGHRDHLKEDLHLGVDQSLIVNKNSFDIEHPSKGEGYRLVYACIEPRGRCLL